MFVTLRVALIAGLFGLGTLGNIAPASAGSHTPADPAIGPNTRDEISHQHDSLHLTPVNTRLLPRQARPAIGLANSAGPLATGTAGPLKREVFGFAPYYHLSDASSWNYSLISTIAYFGIGINWDGTLNTSEPGYAGWNSQQLADIINAAHAAGDRVVVTIRPIRPDPSHDTAWTVNSIVTDPTHTQAAITSTINAMKAKAVDGVPVIDGVNVDFEGSSDPYPSVQNGFTSFVTKLSQQAKQLWPTSMITADTYTGSASWDGGIFNISQLAPVVDGLFVMAYDESFGNTPGHAGANAPLDGGTYNDSLSVTQYLTKSPASKVILGVPYYDYKVSTLTNGPNATIVSGTGAQVDGYSDLPTDLTCGQLHTDSWDYVAQSPWAAWWSPKVNDPCGGNHGTWRELYYDDPTSLGIKYDLVNNNGLLGAGIWELGFQGTSQDLWRVIADKFETAWPGQYQPLPPARILDTRTTIGGHPGPVPGGQNIDVSIAGAGGVPPSGAAAVVLNATVVNPTAPSHLIIYPYGAGRARSSNLNFVPGQTVANLVEVALGSNGMVSVYNNAGSTDMILDVEGWVSTNPALSAAGRFQATTPTRLLDTRSGFGGSTALGASGTYDLPVSNNAAVPAAGVSAEALNLMVTNPSAAGYVSAYLTGVQRPNTSNVNFVRGLTVANRIVVPVGTGGKVTLYNCCGRTDLVVDVAGYFTDGSSTASAGQLTAMTSVRIVDTRSGFGLASAIGSGITSVPVRGQATVPRGATAVAINVTVTNPTAAGYLTVFPDGSSPPNTSDINFAPGQTVANFVLAKLGADGQLALFNYAGSTDVIIDVVGWYN